MLKVIFTVLGLAHLWACDRQRGWLFYLTKPGAMLALLALAWQLGALGSPYGRWLLAGLALSTVGDIFLMLPKERFIAGLSAFLLAHLCYVAAFWPGLGAPHWPWLALLVLAAAPVAWLLWPGLGVLKGPVVGYMAAIVAMAWLAGERYLGEPNVGTALAAAGALVFMLSDSLLALDRFRRPFKGAQLLVMATYFSAQYLLVLSLA
ncbi:lysoplasmalogenase [Gallaecimonas kandeliae]|uniref:lysoplasmalogenase n=1 Tax=Gallaecimonas kandeliae TaxID=3029055 RepID=UPI0026493CFD|nr:lysoplasmalogenase [Gallaecimonas kandeliae]WKE64237.1 lysoplasmalogenase [Gallaecimonas kandeliae]